MSVFDMIKNIYKKNTAQKQTADSSKTVSRPVVKTTSSNDGAKNRNTNTQKSEASYWQATQQTQNQKSTQKAKQQMSMPKAQKATRQTANKRDKESADKAQKYAEAQKKARSYNPEKQYDYGQANAGLEELFKNPIKALNGGSEKAMRRYYDANRKLVKHDTQRRQKQAEAAQAQVDLTKEALEQHPDLKAWSDLGLSTLGGLTSGVGGLLKTGTTLARGIAGATGNRDFEKKVRQWDADLGVDQALQNVNEGNLVANNMMGQVAQSVGNMIPTIAANALTGGGAGLGVMGASVFGNEGSEALNRLASDGRLTREDALRGLTTGALKAGLEVGSESITGFIPGLETFAFTNPNHLLGQAGGEALEEMFSSAIEPVIDTLADPNVQRSNTTDIHGRRGLDFAQAAYNNTFGNASQYGRDIAQSGLLGAATSLALGGGANVASNLAEQATNNSIANQIEEAVNAYQTPNNPTIARAETATEAEPVMPDMTNLPEETVTPQQTNNTASENTPEGLTMMTTPRPDAKPLNMPEPQMAVPEVEMAEVNPNSTQATEIEGAEPAWNNYTPSQEDNLQVANENGEVFEPKTEKDSLASRVAEKVKSLFNKGDSKASDPSMDYILSHVRQAVTSGDQKAVQASANEVINAIGAETNLPQEVIEQIKGNLEINQTAERLSEGDAVGYVQETVNKTDKAEYKAKINRLTDDTTYERTRLTPVSNVAKQMNAKVGDMNKVYDDLMKSSLGKGKIDRFSKAFKSQFGIQTDYDAVVYTARVMDLKDQLSSEMNKITDEIKANGYEVELIPTPSGENTVRFKKDGKVVNPAEMSEQAKNLADLSAKNDDITLRATNIGHNVGTILRMFRTDLLSPAGQIKGINQTIERINAELDQKFAKKIKSGELEHVKLNDDLVKTFLEATDDETRMATMEQIGADIGRQVPPTFMDKLDAFRYNNLLFNGLTWVRNGLGNFTQSQMSNAKNLSLYIIESYAKARGLVRYNNLDMSNAGDKSLWNGTSRLTSDTLINDFADAKKSGNVKQHLKSLGYSGSLLNTMQHYKGQSFDLNQIDSGFKPVLDEVLANNAKKSGYSVDNGKVIGKDGNAISDKTYRELMSESYKQAKKRWISSDSLRRAKVDGVGMGTASHSQRSLFWNEGFNILNPDYESVVGLRSDNNVAGKDAFMKGYNEARRSEIFSDNNPFGWIQNRESRIIDYAMNKAPLLGDDYWLRSGYSKAMASMLDTRGYHAVVNDGTIELYDDNGDLVPSAKANSILAELNGEALQWAKEDTYHDRNELANLLNEFARTSNLAKFTVNSTIPFINTPMNIARRAIEYSPIGLGASLIQLNDVKAGKISASTWLNNMAKGATGVSAMAIGAWLAKNGILRALGEKDDDEIHRFETAKGLQDYSIQIPFADGWSTTVDWLAPGVAPFLLGAAMWEQHSQYVPRSENESMAQGAINLLMEDFANFGTLFKPIADTTMLSGLMDTLSVFGEETWAQDLGAQLVQNYVRQLTPVLGSKIQGIFDPVKYSTSSDSFLDRQLRSAAINIRLIDYAMTAINGEQYLKPQIDLNGNPIETQDYGLGAAGRAITNLLNPATVKEDTRDKTDLELERLYSVTNQKYLLPSITASINGTKFTPKERDEFNRYLLPEYKKACEEFINSASYGDYTDDERAKILYNMKSHFYTEAQARYLGRIIPNADQVLTPRDKACDFANTLGISTAHFYGYINTDFDKTKDGETINNTRAMKIRAQMEADGVWDRVKRAIDNEVFKPSDFNLNNAVTGWDTTDFTYYYNQMLNGQYDGKLRKKK